MNIHKEITAHYTPTDIETLIKKDLESKGYNVLDTKFIIRSKKQKITLGEALAGANPPPTIEFTGVKARIKGEIECENRESIELDTDTFSTKEKMLYVETIKAILDRNYGKEVVFYDEGEWYSRDHSRNINLDELQEYILKVTDPGDE